jgi:hypothetical protein
MKHHDGETQRGGIDFEGLGWFGVLIGCQYLWVDSKPTRESIGKICCTKKHNDEDKWKRLLDQRRKNTTTNKHNDEETQRRRNTTTKKHNDEETLR